MKKTFKKVLVVIAGIILATGIVFACGESECTSKPANDASNTIILPANNDGSSIWDYTNTSKQVSNENSNPVNVVTNVIQKIISMFTTPTDDSNFVDKTAVQKDQDRSGERINSYSDQNVANDNSKQVADQNNEAEPSNDYSYTTPSDNENDSTPAVTPTNNSGDNDDQNGVSPDNGNDSGNNAEPANDNDNTSPTVTPSNDNPDDTTPTVNPDNGDDDQNVSPDEGNNSTPTVTPSDTEPSDDNQNVSPDQPNTPSDDNQNGSAPDNEVTPETPDNQNEVTPEVPDEPDNDVSPDEPETPNNGIMPDVPDNQNVTPDDGQNVAPNNGQGNDVSPNCEPQNNNIPSNENSCGKEPDKPVVIVIVVSDIKPTDTKPGSFVIPDKDTPEPSIMNDFGKPYGKPCDNNGFRPNFGNDKGKCPDKPSLPDKSFDSPMSPNGNR